MEEYVSAQECLKRPVLGRTYKGASLQQLKASAQQIEREGGTVIDQSAGDISLVGKPLNPNFREYRDGIGAVLGMRPNPEDPGMYDLPQNYAAEYPKVVEMIARRGLEIEGPFEGMSTVSGRAAINCYLTALRQESEQMDASEGVTRKPTIIVDPLTWSGYQDSAAECGIRLVYSPMVEGNGVLQSPEGLREALEFVKGNPGLRPMGVTTIQPSNPTGLGVSPETLAELATICAEADINFNIDAFYSVIARGGLDIIGLKELQKLPPEVQARISVLVGETKATDSQKKTATMMWLNPEGNGGKGKATMAKMKKIKGNWNLYARPDEAITAAALWAYEPGIHAAMGERYHAINSARELMAAELSGQIPFIIGDSFYGTGALVAPDGRPLVRDKDGCSVSDPKAAMAILLNDHGLMVAPGAMFRPEGAELMARFTAASTPAEIMKVSGVIRNLLEQANK